MPRLTLVKDIKPFDVILIDILQRDATEFTVVDLHALLTPRHYDDHLVRLRSFCGSRMGNEDDGIDALHHLCLFALLLTAKLDAHQSVFKRYYTAIGELALYESMIGDYYE